MLTANGCFLTTKILLWIILLSAVLPHGCLTALPYKKAKAWAREQVRLMDEAEKEDSAKFNIELCAGTDLPMEEQRRFKGG